MRWCHCGMATCRFMVSKKSGSSQFFVRKNYCDSVMCFWGSVHYGNGWFLQFYTYFNSYFFSCFFLQMTTIFVIPSSSPSLVSFYLFILPIPLNCPLFSPLFLVTIIIFEMKIVKLNKHIFLLSLLILQVWILCCNRT